MITRMFIKLDCLGQISLKVAAVTLRFVGRPLRTHPDSFDGFKGMLQHFGKYTQELNKKIVFIHLK